MRLAASIPIVLAIIVACGSEIDTSVESPKDAGTTPDSGGPTGQDATTTADASVGDDDDDTDAGVDAMTDPSTDAGADADADADADAGKPNPIPCTAINEPFAAPWSRTMQGWEAPPSEPGFVVASIGQFATFQTTSVNTPKPALVHGMTKFCALHLTMSMRFSDDAVYANVLVARIAMQNGTLDFYRLKGGALQVQYLGDKRAVGQLNIGVFYNLSVTISSTSEMSIMLNGLNSAQGAPTLPPGPPPITQLQFGVVDVVFDGAPAKGATFTVDLDDIVVN